MSSSHVNVVLRRGYIKIFKQQYIFQRIMSTPDYPTGVNQNRKTTLKEKYIY